MTPIKGTWIECIIIGILCLVIIRLSFPPIKTPLLIQFTGPTGPDTGFVEVIIPDEITYSIYNRQGIEDLAHHDTINHCWRYLLKNTNHE